MLGLLAAGLSFNVGGVPSGTISRSSTVVHMNAAEEAAKAAWLAKQDTPSWGPAASGQPLAAAMTGKVVRTRNPALAAALKKAEKAKKKDFVRRAGSEPAHLEPHALELRPSGDCSGLHTLS